MSQSQLTKGVNWMSMLGLAGTLMRNTFMFIGSYVVGTLWFGTLPTWILTTACVCLTMAIDIGTRMAIQRDVAQQLRVEFQAKHDAMIVLIRSAMSSNATATAQVAESLTKPQVVATATEPKVQTQPAQSIVEVVERVVGTATPVLVPA